MLSPELILQNWEKHLKIIDRFISSPRKEKVLEMYEAFNEEIVMAPASGKAHFHNAFAGGYIDHVNRVVEASLRVKGIWEVMGARVEDFTDEEIVFAALFHDFGKMGDAGVPGYIPQTDKWRQEKLNELYSNNTDLPFMLIQDRSLYLLQKFGISTTMNEYLAIRLHDGIYDEANKAYYVSNSPDSKFRTNIVNILHQADLLAARVEYDAWKAQDKPKNSPTSTKKQKPELKGSETLINIVKDI
jgi:hypothetical protein